MPKAKTFKDSFERLKEISDLLDKDEVIDVDTLIKVQKEAKELYKFCGEKLEGVSAKLEDETK
ncbi:exodeoxyribonuclease VII small subunit [Candidatus Gracilibacteria bacterium]|nr:exodeoxyribonuclease VII small subunit [Candidatus Gracilibacteria bacterium]